MKIIVSVLVVLLLTGCASSSSEYYEAVQRAAEASSQASQAKFDALSKIAASGDGQAASAAVMALALTQTATVQPIPQQSEAMQWASILASPVTSLGMMWMQSDSTKKMAKYNSQVDLARISSDASTQQALYGSFVSSNQITGDVAAAGMTAMGNVDYTPFVNGMVTLGTTGMTSLTDLSKAGFDANTSIAAAGLNSAVSLGTAGLNSTGNVGIAGINGLVTNTSNWLNYSAANNLVWKDIMATEQKGCVATANAAGQVIVTCN